MKKNIFIYFLLFIVAIIWGGGFLASQQAIDNNWDVFSILFQRCFISFIVTFLIGIKSKFWKNKNVIKIGVIGGIIYFCGYALQLCGQKISTISNTGLITSFGVILVPYIYWLLFKKKPSYYSFIGCFIGLVGGIILSYNPGFKLQLGDLLVFLSSIFYAFHLTYIGKNGDDLNLFGLAATQFLTMSILSLIAIFIGGANFIGDPKGWYGVLYYSLLSGAFGMVVQFYCQRIIESYKVSLVLTLEGLFAVIAAVLLYHEPLFTKVIIGGALMLGAVFYVQINDIIHNKRERKKES